MISLPEGVWIAAFDQAKIDRLWEKLKDFDAFFADDLMRNKETFQNTLQNPYTVVLETESGIFWMCRIVYGVRGEVHLAFWDHRFVGKTEEIKLCLLWAFLTYDLYRIETYLAAYATSTMRFIERKLGFKKEGVMRKRVLHKGRLIDIHIFSLLRDELLEDKNG